MAFTPEEKREKRRIAATAYYWNHRSAILAKKLLERTADPERFREQVRTRRTIDPKKEAAQRRANRAADPERFREEDRAWKRAHHEVLLARRRARYAANSEKEREYSRQQRVANPEKIRAQGRASRASNPERTRIANHTHHVLRRARKAGAPLNDLTHAQWVEIQIAQDHRCYYCKKRRKGHLTQDHITPLSKGGSHTLHNVIAACSLCNSKKGNRQPPIPVQPFLLTVAPSKKRKAA